MAGDVRGWMEDGGRAKRGRKKRAREEVVSGEGSRGSSRKLRRRAGMDEEKDDGRCRPSKGKDGCSGSSTDE